MFPLAKLGPAVIVPFPILVVEASEREIMFEDVATPTVAVEPDTENAAVEFLVTSSVPDVARLSERSAFVTVFDAAPSASDESESTFAERFSTYPFTAFNA